MQYIFWLTIILLFIAGYYSLAFLPRQRAFKKHQHYVLSLNEGDEVITYGGIIGTLTELDAEVGIARLRVAEGIEIRIITAAIIQPYNAEEIARNAQIGLGFERYQDYES